MIPSAKRLEQFFPGKGKELRGLMDGTIDCDDYKSVREWVKRCLNKPTEIERVMCALNEALDASGVEAIFGQRLTWPDLEYVNMGDSYATTIMYDHIRGGFHVGSWASWIEAEERNGNKYD